MRLIFLPLIGLCCVFSSSLKAQTPPETFFAVHCEPNNASPQTFQTLRDFVQAAEARNVPLSLEFGVTWAEMILANPGMLTQVRAWQQNGHAVGGHHHGVNHPFWDGYTDLAPWEVNRMEPWLGTMADFKAVLDPLPGPNGLRFSSIQDWEREWPYGLHYQTDGGRNPTDAVVIPEYRVQNRYGAWHIQHAYLADPLMLADLQALHDITFAPEVFGVVTHVVDYGTIPWIFEDWFDFLQAKDPAGQYNKTVLDIIGSNRLPLEADQSTLQASIGGQVNFDLMTDSSLSGLSYQFLISLDGSDPGYDYGGIYDGGVHLGINPDSWTDFSMMQANSAWLPNFSGVLGIDGEAQATLDTLGPLSPSFIGEIITVIGIAYSGPDIEFSSNAVSIEVQ